MSAQFFGRSGKVLYGAFSIVGMASQPHNVNKCIPDDRVARSTYRNDKPKLNLGVTILVMSLTNTIFRKYLKESCLIKLYYSSHSLRINVSYRSYFQKYDRSRRHLSRRLPSTNGLNTRLSVAPLRSIEQGNSQVKQSWQRRGVHSIIW